MANKQLFQSVAGQFLPKAEVRNEAGGWSYALSPQHALAQYSATGCLNSTFYASAEEQLDQVLKLCANVEPQFIAQTAVYSRQRGAMKDMPALLCAVLAKRDAALLERVFDRVIDDGKMVRNFVQMVRSGVAGRKSLGSVPKRLVRRWLESRSAEQVFRASVGNAPSLADVVKMVHPKPANGEREALYGWLLGRQHNAEVLPPAVKAFEAYKAGARGEVPDVPFQMLTALELGPKEWTAIARQASWQTTRMNLNSFARHGVFKDAKMTRTIANRLRDAEAVRRSRAFPYQLLMAFKAADPGVPHEVREALQDAMEIATENVPAVTGHRSGATTSVRCLDVAALVAAAFVRKNAQAEVLPFSDDVVRVRLNARDSVMTNAEKLAALPSGGTNCSAPLVELNRRGAQGDLVVLVSDNMSWVDSHGGGRSTATMAAWAQFRARNPQARLVCLDIQPNATTQAAERDEVLNIGGFADSVFELIACFARGELQAGHWVGVIQAVTV